MAGVTEDRKDIAFERLRATEVAPVHLKVCCLIRYAPCIMLFRCLRIS